jgi:hypothetical protein
MVDDLDYLTMDSLLRSGTVPNFKRYIANEAVDSNSRS